MEAFSSKMLLIIFAFSFITHFIQAIERPYQQANTLFIKNSCSSTTYPRLCYTSLVKHADSIQTNHVLLTCTALNVTLASAKSTSAMISTLSKSQGLKPREAAAMKDCVEELSDSVDELRRSIGEMSRLRTSNFELTMSDVQTWVSAALTDESTCTDGFQEVNAPGNVQTTVRGKIVQVAQLTSNALALINKLATSHE
ncbi:putative pectinesterase [Medicago truncatula]|uniref:Plant invertase/pectin methylesterase inhibitor n=1 Tax=Medicago truncatula TaxID=3880 RepID=I3T947_MEDTR|nr:21 kDa protein [Medicago truncatula]AFK49039.1 unknown [Medicago truncatula]KEH29367.1 plant invertase/pectin methylesterase inhibitor [Medicago truncatula]RHN59811.1 putative pectinesterase [Medicago truncatula]